MNEKRRGIEKTSKVKKSASLKAPWVVYVVVRVKTRKLSLCRTDRRKSPSLSRDRALARASRAKTLYQKNLALIGHDSRKRDRMLEQRERDSSTTYERDKDKILTERETERKCA